MYIPNNSPLTVYEYHVNAIETLLAKVNRKDQVSSWKSVRDSNYLIPIGPSESLANIINCLLECRLFEINSISNGYDKILDLMFVNDSSKFSVIR